LRVDGPLASPLHELAELAVENAARAMNLFLAVTDNEWFRFLQSWGPLEEVSFWRPGGGAGFRALSPGEPFLFKLHSPEDYVVGGGFFSHFSQALPVSFVWEASASATERRPSTRCAAGSSATGASRRRPPRTTGSAASSSRSRSSSTSPSGSSFG
jgi:hypothetical protein